MEYANRYIPPTLFAKCNAGQQRKWQFGKKTHFVLFFFNFSAAQPVITNKRGIESESEGEREKSRKMSNLSNAQHRIE